LNTKSVHVLVFPGFADWEPAYALAELKRSGNRTVTTVGFDWEGDYPRSSVNELLGEFSAAGVPIAAICAGTLAAARAGLLNDRRHTSNMPGYIAEHVPDYEGASLYQDVPAVNERSVITASGLAPVDFAREIFRQLDIFSDDDDKLWFEMFRHGRIPSAKS
jgi:transcriptional regulator GlxA family with amidase domain